MWWKPWTWFPVGATITRESVWSRGDLDLVIASRDFEAGIGAHGHPLAETTDDEANPANGKGSYYYVADKPVVDWAKHAESVAAERFREAAGKDTNMAGYFFPVRKVKRQPR